MYFRPLKSNIIFGNFLSRVYIYGYYKIDPKEGLLYVPKYVRKSSTCRKQVDNGIFPIKKFDKVIFIQNSGLHVLIFFLTPPMLQTSDLERSDQNCYLKSNNYIIIPRMP